jgi:methylthioribose-1-phosphate isomerase
MTGKRADDKLVIGDADMEAVRWLDDRIEIIDQTRLPWEEVYLQLSHYQEVVQAIKEMRVRGAPMIGIIAAYGIALGAQSVEARSKEHFLTELQKISQTLASTRPTAFKLFQAIKRMTAAAQTAPHRRWLHYPDPLQCRSPGHRGAWHSPGSDHGGQEAGQTSACHRH